MIDIIFINSNTVQNDKGGSDVADYLQIGFDASNAPEIRVHNKINNTWYHESLAPLNQQTNIKTISSKTAPTLTGVNENFNINNTRIIASGNVCILQLDIKVTTAVSLTTSYLKLFDIPNGYSLYAGSDVFGFGYAQLNGIPIVIDISVNGVYAKALTGTVQLAVNDLLRGSISWVR